MPEITVLLPVYNGANYLRESIDSVLAQTFTDFELLVIDDLSTDESPEIVKSYGDPRVRYLRAEEFGLFKAINRGISESKSTWVRLWAHDDRMLPNCLEATHEFAANHPGLGMIYCDFVAISSTGERTGNEVQFHPMRARTPDTADPRQSALLFFAFGCLPGNISTVMLNRDAWAAVGGFWEEKQQTPDFDMWVRISERYHVGFIREPLIELRDHPQQLGRLGQKLLTTIEEELPVIESLRSRLTGIATARDCRRFWRDNRGCQHIHWVMKALLRRDIPSARRGWLAVKGYGQPYAQWWKWLISLNGRVVCQHPVQFFDANISNL